MGGTDKPKDQNRQGAGDASRKKDQANPRPAGGEKQSDPARKREEKQGQR